MSDIPLSDSTSGGDTASAVPSDSGSAARYSQAVQNQQGDAGGGAGQDTTNSVATDSASTWGGLASSVGQFVWDHLPSQRQVNDAVQTGLGAAPGHDG